LAGATGNGCDVHTEFIPGLKELVGLTKLQRLELRNTLVTDAGVQELQKALPKVRISR